MIVDCFPLYMLVRLFNVVHSDSLSLTARTLAVAINLRDISSFNVSCILHCKFCYAV